MFSKINSIGLFGMNAFGVDVEVEVSRGQEKFEIVGLADVAVKESKERIASAFRSSQISFPKGRVTVNLAPADVKKSGSAHDLAIAMAILAGMGAIIDDDFADAAFIGELSLGGELRAVKGALPTALYAMEHGIKRLFVPSENAFEASVAEGIRVYGVKTLRQLLTFAEGSGAMEAVKPYVPDIKAYDDPLDFADVKGQMFAKKALEIAASGGHNVIMIGSPGSGKSMLAKRMPSILPKMSFRESIETTNIYSIAGLIDPESPLITVRPFRSPHHTVSSAGLSGGGSVPRPGEISLAHNGLLFLDELAEFERPTLEILRQPIEDGRVTISRAAGTVTYPCRIMIIAAMNPCPCGYYGHPTRKCVCSQKQVSQYLSRVSGPLLDRFDMHVEVAPANYGSISSNVKAEPSAAIRERVQRARDIQQKRFSGTDITCNAQITSDILHEVCRLTPEADSILKDVFDKLGLSARSYDRILKVSRTIADMDGAEIIDRTHIAKAVRYRCLDRKYYG